MIKNISLISKEMALKMKYRVKFRKEVLKFLSKINEKDRKKIEERINELAIEPRNERVIKLSCGYRYRVRQGVYRIIFSIHDDNLLVEIIRVGHRKNVYKELF